MEIAFLHKGFLSLACCLLVASGLTAQVVDAPPEGAQDRAARPIGIAIPKDGVQLPPPPLSPLQEVQLRKVPNPDEQEQWRTMQSVFLWVARILIGLSAALGGGWGVRQALRKEPVPASNTPITHVEELGLG